MRCADFYALACFCILAGLLVAVVDAADTVEITGETAQSDEPGREDENQWYLHYTTDNSGINSDGVTHDVMDTGNSWLTWGPPSYLTFDLQQVYNIAAMRIWNNHRSPARGVQSARVQYSVDNITWTELGVCNWPQPAADQPFQYDAEVDFGGVSARYIKWTDIANFGDSSGQVGLAEVIFYASTTPLIEFTSDQSAGLEAVSPAVIPVTLSRVETDTFTVDYAAAGGTAVEGTDYVLPAGTLTFDPGQTSRDIILQVIDDGVDEQDEAVILELSNPTGPEVALGATTLHTYTIVDPRPAVGFQTPSSSGVEETGDVQLEVTLEAPLSGTVTVDYEATGGTAVQGEDYDLTAGTLTFNPGQTLRYINLTVFDDLLREGHETVAVTLSRSTGAKISTAGQQHTYKILDVSAACIPNPDLNLDGAVDYLDIACLANTWLWNGPAGGFNAADLDCEGSVNFVDYATMQSLSRLEFDVAGIRFLLVNPAGDAFTMGRNVSVGETYSYEGPPHQVTMTRPFYITQATISQSSYQQSGLAGSVEDIAWDQANDYAEWLSAQYGYNFRLPSEAEWEYLFENPSVPTAGDVQGMGTGREWTGDWFAPFTGVDRTDPMGPRSGVMKVVRSDATKREALAMNARGQHGLGSMKFRLVADVGLRPESDFNAAAFNHAAVKQDTSAAIEGPGEASPYFHVRFAQAIPPDTNEDRNGALVGLDGAVWSHNHSPGLTALPNGDLIACWFSARTRQGTHENETDSRFIWARLRHGSDIWELPEIFYDTRMNDQSASLFTDENGAIWSINGGRGNGNLLFKLAKSEDNGATWISWFPQSANPSGSITPQPIPVPFRDNGGNIYFAMDGGGTNSFVWKSSDGGLNWVDQGSRTSSRHSAIVPVKDPANRLPSDPFTGILSIFGKENNVVQFSGNWGQSWSNWPYQHNWFTTGSNQRPAAYRLANGDIVCAQDSADARHGDSGPNPFVAISTNEGQTWTTKTLPVARPHQIYYNSSSAAGTLGYASITQTPNGLIHVMSTMSAPGLHWEFNEAWVFSGSGDMTPERTGGAVRQYSENYTDGSPRAVWTARITPGGRYLLDGTERTYYPDGTIEYDAIYESGLRVSADYYAPNGDLVWSWDQDNMSNTAAWTHYWPSGNFKLQSHWQTYPSVPVAGGGSRRFRGMMAHGNAVHYDRSGAQTASYTFNMGCRGSAWSCIDQSD